MASFTKSILLCFALITFLGGCTKKNTSKPGVKPAPKAVQAPKPEQDSKEGKQPTPAESIVPKVEETVVVDPPKTDPPAHTASQPPPVTTSTGGANPTPQPVVQKPAAPVTAPIAVVVQPTPAAAPQPAAPQPLVSTLEQSQQKIMEFESCYEKNLVTYLAKFKSNLNKKILPKQLYESRIEVTKACQGNAFENDDLDYRLNLKTAEIAKKEFPDSRVEIKFFFDAENKEMKESDRKKTYEDYAVPAVVSAPEVKPSTNIPVTTATPTLGNNQGIVSKPVSTEPAKVAPAAPVVPQVPTATKPPVAETKGQLAPPTKTPVTSAQTQNQTKPTAAVEIKDLESFEKCLKQEGDKGLKKIKTTMKKIVSPLQVLMFKDILELSCKFKKSQESDVVLQKALKEVVLANFPEASGIMDFILKTEKLNLNDRDKMSLYMYYGVGVEVQSNKFQIQGSLESAESVNNLVTYSVSQYSGELIVTVQPVGREPTVSRRDLSKMPKPNIRFVFDFNLKENKWGTLTIIEGQNSFPLIFQFISGSLEKFKSNEPISVTLSPESWKKVIDAQLNLLMGVELKDAAKQPLTIEYPQNASARTCMLNAAKMVCLDPDSKAKISVNTNALIKSK